MSMEGSREIQCDNRNPARSLSIKEAIYSTVTVSSAVARGERARWAVSDLFEPMCSELGRHGRGVLGRKVEKKPTFDLLLMNVFHAGIRIWFCLGVFWFSS